MNKTHRIYTNTRTGAEFSERGDDTTMQALAWAVHVSTGAEFHNMEVNSETGEVIQEWDWISE
jgi:hypothetical protein